MSVALILAGHGSHISPNTAGVVWNYVDALRQRGVADEITATFWKEQPHFADVLRGVASDTVVIVPLFTASGYFSKEVIPSEMRLTGDITQRNGKTIYYTKTLGEHPAIPDIVQQRVTDTLSHYKLAKDETSVAVIGHGTKRSATTRKTTQAQVNYLQGANIVADVVDAYLDDDPNIPSIYDRLHTKNIIAVPFFLAEGSHATQDVPEALGISYGDVPSEVDGRTVYYTAPIGSDEVVLDLILSLARETGIDFQNSQVREGLKPSPTADGDTKKQFSIWQNFPQKGHDALLDALTDEDFIFGDLLLSKSEVKPVNSTSEISLTTPASLRQHIRENPFRPLASSSDLARDWYVPVEDVRDIPAIVETIYPNAIADWSAQQVGTFEVITPKQKILAEVDTAIIEHHVTSICGRCCKYPAWYDANMAIGTIPCPSPCNVYLSAMKENTTDDR